MSAYLCLSGIVVVVLFFLLLLDVVVVVVVVVVVAYFFSFLAGFLAGEGVRTESKFSGK